jgi:hypothetical protein
MHACKNRIQNYLQTKFIKPVVLATHIFDPNSNTKQSRGQEGTRTNTILFTVATFCDACTDHTPTDTSVEFYNEVCRLNVLYLNFRLKWKRSVQ